MHVLVAGCGSIGTRHVRNLRSMEDVEVTVCDRDPHRLDAIAADGGATRLTIDLPAALADKPDAVIICTPTHTHIDLAHQALDAGAHVLIEKPLSHSLDGVRGLAEHARQSGCVVMVGCNMRFHPPVMQMNRWLEAGRIGSLHIARLQYGHYLPNWRAGDYRQTYSARAQQGGGIMLEAIQMFDLADAWLEGVMDVTAYADKLSSLEIEAEDTASVLLRSPHRRHASIQIDYLCRERTQQWELVGSEGIIRWTGRGKSPERSIVECYDASKNTWEKVNSNSDLNLMYVNQWTHFVESMKNHTRPVMGVDRAAEILALVMAAKESAARCTPVYLNEFMETV